MGCIVTAQVSRCVGLHWPWQSAGDRGGELGASTWWRPPSHLSSFVRDLQGRLERAAAFDHAPKLYRESADMLTHKPSNLRIVPPD